MVAFGLGAPALWMLPVVFPLVMAGGGALGPMGVPLRGVELSTALSAVMLDAMVALAARPPLWLAAVLVGSFAGLPLAGSALAGALCRRVWRWACAAG